MISKVVENNKNRQNFPQKHFPGSFPIGRNAVTANPE